MIRHPNGRYQVTYAGLPRYTYLNDKRSGDVRGEGIEKIWYAVSPTGRIVKPGA
jgi:predicted lipoprotein with Yx(FWY)xxD motif